MLDKNELTEIAKLIANEYKFLLEKAHKESDTKQIAKIMEDISTAIIKEFTDRKAMGELALNFNALVKYLLEHFPRFYYYFDMLSQNRSNTRKRTIG